MNTVMNCHTVIKNLRSFNDNQLNFSTLLTERSVNIEFPLHNYKGANANKAIDIDDLFQTARKSLTYNFEIHVRI